MASKLSIRLMSLAPILGAGLASALLIGCGTSAPSAPVAVEPYPDPVVVINPDVGERKDRLHLIHTQVVQIFIGQERFGGGRMLRVLDEDIVNPASQATVADPRFAIKDPQVILTQDPRHSVAPAVQGQPKGSDMQPKKKEAHHSFQQGVANMRLDSWFADAKEPWHFQRVQLLGLVKNPQPVVYETELVASKNAAEPIPTRPLDPSEQRGVEALRAKSKMYIEKIDQQLRVVAPIYAGESCLKCHQTKGELLGAFVYSFAIGKAKPQAEVEP